MAGKGKSTFLNFLLNKMIFKAKQSAGSVTIKSETAELKLMGEICNIHDWPGLCAGDMSLEEWKTHISVTSIDIVLWVVSAKDRVTLNDTTLFNAMNYVLSGINVKNIILVMTNCDTIDLSETTLEEISQDFIVKMKEAIKSDKFVNFEKIIYFGKGKSLEIDDFSSKKKFIEFHKELLKNRPDIIQIKEKVTTEEFSKIQLESFNPGYYKRFENEIKERIEKEEGLLTKFLKVVGSATYYAFTGKSVQF